MTITPSGHTVLRAGIAAITIETIAVFLRLLARRTCKAAFAVDDWFVIASLLPSYGMFVIGGLRKSTMYSSTRPFLIQDRVHLEWILLIRETSRHQGSRWRAHCRPFAL